MVVLIATLLIVFYKKVLILEIWGWLVLFSGAILVTLSAGLEEIDLRK